MTGGVLYSGGSLKTSVDGQMSGRGRVFGRWAFVLMVGGEGRYQDERGASAAVRPGDLILVFPDVAHRYGPGPGEAWRELFVVSDSPVLDAWRSAGLLREDRPVWRLSPVSYWRERMERLVKRCGPAGAAVGGAEGPRVSDVCRLLTFLADAIESTGRPSLGGTREAALAEMPAIDRHWATEVTGLIDDRLRRGPIDRLDPASLASAMHVSEAVLRRRFVRLLGEPPARYVSRRTIERACELMQQGELSDKQIAAELGFCDEFHFSKRFKQLIGASPRDYRRRLP